MCLRPMLCVSRKLFRLIFPVIKRKRLTLMLTPYCQKRQSSLSLEFVCFVIRKLSVKLMWRSFCYLYIYLKVTKVYGIKLTISVYYRIFLQIDRCSEIILATAKNKFRIICIEITIRPVCRWCILKLSVSFTEFISSISERLTAVPKFPNFFFYSVVFKAFVLAQSLLQYYTI